MMKPNARNISYPFWTLLLFCCLVGCSEVIDLGTRPGESQLLIFGRITSGLEGNFVEIARTSPVNNEQTPVMDASVFVVSASGEREQYRRLTLGQYQLLNGTLMGQPGETYHLEVTLSDGSQYRSVPATMPERMAEDVLDFEPRSVEIRLENNQGTIRRNVVDFFMTTRILEPENDNFIRWNLIETYIFPERFKMVNIPDPPPQWCYITNDLEQQQVFLYDGSTLKANEIARRFMTSRLADKAFVSEYYFQAVRSSLTSDAFRFWDELNEVTNSQGSIFDRPMGPVNGNLFNVNNPDERVLGYFEVSQVDTTRILVRTEDTPFDIRLPCPQVGPVGPECIDCLVLKNSIKEKPHWVD